MTGKGFSIQGICGSDVKAYTRLCKYIETKGRVFKWTSPGRRIQHKRRNYPGYVELETTANEVVLAWTSKPSPDTLGSFMGILVRCFGDDLISINIQRHNSN